MPRAHKEKSGMVAQAYSPRLWGIEIGPGAHWLAKLAYPVHSRPHERLSQKVRWMARKEQHLRGCPLGFIHSHTHVHTLIY